MYSGYLQSDFDSAPLERIASISGGKYYGVQTIGDLANVLSSIGREMNVVQSYHLRTESVRYYDRFIVAAVILFAFVLFICRVYLQELI